MIHTLRLLLVLTGILFLLLDLHAYVRQKLTDTMGILWAVVSAALIVAGAVSVPGRQELFYVTVLLFIVCLLLLFLLFKVSKMLSVLAVKNQELAMQVSLLNQENERILHKLGILHDGNEEKDTVCH